jgi:sugar phosphate isomerase/epimerase
MLVALHSAPKGFFASGLPTSTDDLVRFARRAASMGFRAVQIGPLTNVAAVNGAHLAEELNRLRMERNVHIGGIYSARKFALTEEEYAAARSQTHLGIELCRELSSTLISVHPPFFESTVDRDEQLALKAKARFFRLLKEQVDFASINGIKMAVESFCYSPFIFEDLADYVKFVSQFPPDKLGVLFDVGHVYQMGFDISEAVNLFKERLFDIHVHDATLEKDYRKATHLPIGKGTIDFPEFIDCLKRAEYDAWLSLEIKGSDGEILESKEYLERLITKAR